MTNRPLAIIANKDTEEKELLAAIQELGAATESVKFWTNIASSSEYGKVHRRHCVFQLFYRHVLPGMKLSELAQMLDDPNWLEDEYILVVEDLAGFIPVKLTFENTVFVLGILPGLQAEELTSWAIYLSVSGEIDRGSFIRLLHGKEVHQRVRDSVVLEIGFNPPIQ